MVGSILFIMYVPLKHQALISYMINPPNLGWWPNVPPCIIFWLCIKNIITFYDILLKFCRQTFVRLPRYQVRSPKIEMVDFWVQWSTKLLETWFWLIEGGRISFLFLLKSPHYKAKFHKWHRWFPSTLNGHALSSFIKAIECAYHTYLYMYFASVADQIISRNQCWLRPSVLCVYGYHSITWSILSGLPLTCAFTGILQGRLKFP